MPQTLRQQLQPQLGMEVMEKQAAEFRHERL